ncbi:MAG TPA: PAS domain S-box protein [Gammaproteobacteria bacterium]|nr:PAS domain S-box protein [Gammaproteobacteria bacterium]
MVGTEKPKHPYRLSFEEAPISLWVEDFSAVKVFLDQLRSGGVDDLRAYFDSHPQAVQECSCMVKIIDINRTTLNLFKARNKKELLTRLDKTFTAELFNVFAEELLTLAEGKTSVDCEAVAKTLLGERLNIILQITVVPGCEDTWAHVLVAITDITERKQAEKRASGLSRILEESLNEIFIFDADTLKFIQANHGARRNLGYEMAELRKLTPLDLKPEFTKKLFDELLEPLKVGKQEKIQFTTVHRRKDGSQYPVEIHLQLSILESRKVFVAIILDITERKKSEQALLDLQSQTRQIIDTAPDAFVSMDTDGTITDWNPQAEETFGWSRQQAIGQVLYGLIIPSQFRTAYKEQLQHFLTTGEGQWFGRRTEITALHRDGHEFPVELIVVEVRYPGKVGFNAFIHDLTDQAQTRRALKDSLTGTIMAVSKAFEVRDPYTAGHQQRVAQLACSIAQKMGLDGRQTEGVRMGATIHDLGKICLPAEILSKPTKLTALEFELIKNHTHVGYDILKDIPFPWPIADIAYQHHERMDGSGYPQGLKGDAICLEARITAVADVVEAMSSHRPYRPSLGIDKALEEIERFRGERFDANVTDACLNLLREQGFVDKARSVTVS